MKSGIIKVAFFILGIPMVFIACNDPGTQNANNANPNTPIVTSTNEVKKPSEENTSSTNEVTSPAPPKENQGDNSNTPKETNNEGNDQNPPSNTTETNKVTNVSKPPTNPSGENNKSSEENKEGEKAEEEEKKDEEEMVNLSFKGANIDAIIQWLSKTTGKSIIKHPQANCRVTIVSVGKLPKQEALDLVYHALSLEGFTTADNGKSIIILPENVDSKVKPDLVNDEDPDYPNGWRKVMRVFELKNVQASEMEDKIKGLLSKSAKVDADDTVNKLIVTDLAENIEILDELLDILDVEQEADYTVRMIPIKNVDAEDLSNEIDDLFDSRSSNNLRVEITANERSNSLIIRSSATDFKSIEDIVGKLDTEDAQQRVLRQFQLVNADAQEVATQLETLFENQGSSRNRYDYYSYRRYGNSEENVSVVADPRRNTLLVQGPPGSMGEIEDLIKALDEPISEDSLTPQIFQLEYVSAVDMEEVLTELFDENTNERNYWGGWDPWGNRSNNGNNSSNTGRLLGKVRITAEPYSNSIIVTTNSPENAAAVEDVLKTLDVPSQAGDTTLRVPLNFAEAVKVANSINVLFAKAGSPPSQGGNNNNQRNNNNPPNNQNNQNQPNSGTSFELERRIDDRPYYPWLGGQQDNNRFGATLSRPVSELVGRVRIVPDPRTNSLLVTSNMNFFPEVLKLVNEMDAPTPQVLIEVRILEVSTDLRDKIGVRFNSGNTDTFESDDFEGSILGSATGGFGDTISNIFGSDSSTGVLDATININMLVQFLRKNADATVLAEPQVNVADNELGRLFVGSQVPFISGSLNTREGGRNDSFNYRDVGIILEVTPQINNDQEVALKIRVESSNIRAGETLFGGAILDTRSFRTDLLVRDRQTVVLGGIIQKDETELVRKVPILGDIPILGYAFKKKDKVQRNVELMVFLTPRITRSPDEVSSLTREIEYNTPRIRAWREKTDMNRIIIPPQIRDEDENENQDQNNNSENPDENVIEPDQGESRELSYFRW